LINIEKAYPNIENKTINVFVDYSWLEDGIYGQLYPIYHKDSINKWIGNSILFFVLRDEKGFKTFADNKKWQLYGDTIPYTPLPNIDVLYKINSDKDTTFELYSTVNGCFF